MLMLLLVLDYIFKINALPQAGQVKEGVRESGRYQGWGVGVGYYMGSSEDD